jgi:hypothetical protein
MLARSEGGLTKDDDTGCSVSNFLILRSSEFNHGLRSGVSDVDFSKDGMTVVGESTD